MTSHIIANSVIVSPLEIRHFALNIPYLKKTLQLGAVTYALRPLYPGSPESTVIDFRCTRTGTVGIVTARKTLDSYRQYGLPLCSSSLAVAAAQRGGIAVCISKNWAEFLLLKDGIPVVMRCLVYTKMSQLTAFADTFFEQQSIESGTDYQSSVYMMPDAEVAVIEALPQFNRFRKIDFADIMDTKIQSACEIYTVREKNTGERRFPAMLPVFFVVFGLFFIDAVFVISAKNKTEEMLAVKRAYELKKQQVTRYEKELRTKHVNTEDPITERIPVYTVLTEIQKSGVSRLNSFTLTDSFFRIDGEGTAALAVFEKLQQSSSFSEVMLHQATPSGTQRERCIISGNIRQ